MWLINRRMTRVVATDVLVACTRADRRRGLLGRDGLSLSTGMILSPCCAVHTAFMRFPIDVVFLTGDGVVRRVVPNLMPWRMAVDVGARMVVEIAAGAAALHDVCAGDRLYLSVTSGDDDAFLSSVAPSLRRMASNPACAGS